MHLKRNQTHQLLQASQKRPSRMEQGHTPFVYCITLVLSRLRTSLLTIDPCCFLGHGSAITISRGSMTARGTLLYTNLASDSPYYLIELYLNSKYQAHREQNQN